ncbi:rRNA maturation RNase YbeY [candidate division KSB1 bacterium 4484_188]|nr:MAG: rRNA maturation RNase YbeY [candidate division KSB1 bacterium 4484_188]HFE64307.1 rRNA maturation RNase YbeY [Caldithrix sp.]
MKRKTDIHFITQHPSCSKTLQLKDYKPLVQSVIQAKNIPIKQLRVILVDDEYLRTLHAQYLHDDSYTDVMTFNLSETGEIEGEIYISLDRARIHAREYGVAVRNEVARLIIHGLLHLKGMDDRTPAQRQEMHRTENRLLGEFWER